MNNKEIHAGRTTIGDPLRRANSKRAYQGKLSVIKKDCPKCFSKKAFNTINQTKCTRCNYYHEKTKVWVGQRGTP